MISKMGIVSFIMALLAVVNFVLLALGISPLPVEETSIEGFVTAIFAVAGIAGTAWHNFTVTDTQKMTDMLALNIKQGNVDFNEANRLVNNLLEAGSALTKDEAVSVKKVKASDETRVGTKKPTAKKRK